MWNQGKKPYIFDRVPGKWHQDVKVDLEAICNAIDLFMEQHLLLGRVIGGNVQSNGLIVSFNVPVLLNNQQISELEVMFNSQVIVWPGGAAFYGNVQQAQLNAGNVIDGEIIPDIECYTLEELVSDYDKGYYLE